MADSLSFASTGHYAQSPYYQTQHVNHDVVHAVSQPARSEAPQQRKRPKYTRSKTGCLTCRVKKIKCDETKPNCMRCTHGQRECTWPEGVPSRKKTTSRKDSTASLESGRPSTASSSASSTPPTRNPSPPRRTHTAELGLLPMASRRSSDPYLQLHPIPAEPDTTRRSYVTGDRSPLYLQATTTNVSNNFNMIPETNSYRYDQYSYPSTTTYSLPPPRHVMPGGLRPMSHHHHHHHHQVMNQWSSSESMDPYFSGLPDRTLVGHGPVNESHTRY